MRVAPVEWELVIVGIAGIAGTFGGPVFAQRRIEQRGERRAFRGAQRLVVEELDTNTIHMELLIEVGAAPTEADAMAELFPTPSYRQQRETLAVALRDDDWAVVSTVFHALERHRVVLQRKALGDGLSPDELRRLKEGLELVAVTRDQLARAETISD